jgi:hypothetical protein
MSSQTQPQKTSTQQIVSAAADKLVDALRQGRSEAMADYLRVMGRFHRYSFNNVSLLTTSRSQKSARRCCAAEEWVTRHPQWVAVGIPGCTRGFTNVNLSSFSYLSMILVPHQALS